tara:strand:- start:591 stop:887 length:297 start_codon:yes stop_codon:yes gene_type:complete
MKFLQILLTILKNFLAFIIGGIITAALLLLFFIKIYLPSVAPKVGLGILALIPAVVALSVSYGLLIGGILGIIIYQVWRRRKLKKSKKTKSKKKKKIR